MACTQNTDGETKNSNTTTTRKLPRGMCMCVGRGSHFFFLFSLRLTSSIAVIQAFQAFSDSLFSRGYIRKVISLIYATFFLSSIPLPSLPRTLLEALSDMPNTRLLTFAEKFMRDELAVLILIASSIGRNCSAGTGGAETSAGCMLAAAGVVGSVVTGVVGDITTGTAGVVGGITTGTAGVVGGITTGTAGVVGGITTDMAGVVGGRIGVEA